MKFKQIMTFPYGDYNQAHSVLKVFFATDDLNYFLTGYLIKTYEKWKLVINKELNYINDISVVDTDDESKFLIVTDKGTYNVMLTNNKISGLPRILNASIIVEEQEILQESNAAECLEEIKILEKDFPAEYIYFLMRYNKYIYLGKDQSAANFCKTAIVQLYANSKQFKEVIFKNDIFIEQLFKYLFIDKSVFSMTFENLKKFLVIRDVLLEINTEIKDMTDIEYIMRNNITNKSLIQLILNRFLEPYEKQVVISQNRSTEEIKSNIKETLNSFLKLESINIFINNEEFGAFDIKPIYSDELEKMSNNINSVYLRDKKNFNNYVIIVFNDNIGFECHINGKKIYLEKAVDDNFNVIITDDHNYEIIFKGSKCL